jgi:hypothetical protein
MNVRVIIVTHVDESCHVSVLSPSLLGETWAKRYGVKLICLIELVSLGFLSSNEEVESHLSDFNKPSAVMIFQTAIEREVLRAAGFVEQKQNYVH